MWHCDSSCEEIRVQRHCESSCEEAGVHPVAQQRPVKVILHDDVLYVVGWLAELKVGPCSSCTPNIWEMVRRQNPVITDPELQRFVQSSSSGSANFSVPFGSGEILALERSEV